MSLALDGVEERRAYLELVGRVRARIREHVPPGARGLVVSRGDGMLLDVPRRQLEHFPQSPTGLYAGHYPTTGAAAARELRRLRDAGADHLVLPATALWWLDHYAEFAAALGADAELVVDDRETCLIYRLVAPAAGGQPADRWAARTAPQVASLIEALLPPRAGVALVGAAADAVDVGDRPCWHLPAPSDATGTPLADVVARIEAAQADGAGYVVLLNPESPQQQLDGRLRRVLATRTRTVCAQRLAEVLELQRVRRDG